MTPRFLTLAEVEAIHTKMLSDHGGQDGLRNQAGLEAAIGMPRQTFGGEFLHEFPFEMAAAYVFHLAESQAYVDGNKRTGAAAALVFLELNGFTAEPGDWLAETLIDVASGKLDKTGLSLVFQEHANESSR